MREQAMCAVCYQFPILAFSSVREARHQFDVNGDHVAHRGHVHDESATPFGYLAGSSLWRLAISSKSGKNFRFTMLSWLTYQPRLLGNTRSSSFLRLVRNFHPLNIKTSACDIGMVRMPANRIAADEPVKRSDREACSYRRLCTTKQALAFVGPINQLLS